MSITGETTLGELRNQIKDKTSEFYRKLIIRKKDDNKVFEIIGVNANVFDFFMVFILGEISEDKSSKGYVYGKIISGTTTPSTPWRQQCGLFLKGERSYIDPEKLQEISKTFKDEYKLKDYTRLEEMFSLDASQMQNLRKVYDYFCSGTTYDITLYDLRNQIKDEKEKGESLFGKWIVKKIEEYKNDKDNKNALLFLMSLILGGVSTGKNPDNPKMARVKFVTLRYTTGDENWKSVREFLGFLKNSDEIFRNERKNNMPNHNNLQHIDDKITLSCLSNFDSDTDKKLDFKVKDLFFNKDIDDPESKLGISTISEDDKEKRIQLLRDICKDLIEELGGTGMNNNGKGDNSENKDVIDIIEGSIINHNQVIFTGAPGTGKTYSVRKYVKKSGEERYKFVQFHPSYDYTDFIEGLRPVKIGNSDEPTFVRMDGVFKKFCRKIVENNLMKIFNISSSNELCESMIEIVFTILKKANDEKKDTQSEFKKLVDDELKGIIEKLKENLNVTKNNQNDTGDNGHNLNNESTGNFNNNEKENLDIKFLISINDVYEEKIKANLKSLFAEFMKEDNINIDTGNNETTEKNEISQEVNENKNQDIDWYYFVVDEVNRADLSKVFGEIMFGLEESYRGIENRFDTQYMNLNTFIVDEKDGKADVMTFDCFKNGFFIPRNLKFIGTMNDIDRSVESFDFALRRRFHWVDINANDVMESSLSSILKEKMDINKISDLTKRIISMNEVISGDTGKKLGLSEAYHIGPAYFKNYSDNVDNGVYFDQNLESILREYVRGRRTNDIGDFITKCRQAFIDYKKAVAGIEQNNDYIENAGQTSNGVNTDNSSENANQTN